MISFASTKASQPCDKLTTSIFVAVPLAKQCLDVFSETGRSVYHFQNAKVERVLRSPMPLGLEEVWLQLFTEFISPVGIL